MKIYQDLVSSLTEHSTELSSNDRRISIYRFALALAAIFLGYEYYQIDDLILLAAALLIVIAFILIVKKHGQVRWENELTKAKIAINKDEIAYLEKGELPFADGMEFIDSSHDYSYDLDFFGNHSLFQHLNRTGTITGKERLADSMLHLLGKDEIIQNQEAIAELNEKLSWRQELLALAQIRPDSPESVADLLGWSQKRPTKLSFVTNVFSYIGPILALATLLIYAFTPYEIIGRISLLISLLNLGIVATEFKAIKSELVPTTRIEHILRQYGLLFKLIENTSFTSQKLQDLQKRLTQNNHKASQSIHQLSLLFGRLEHVSNVFAAPLINGLFLFHIHVLRGLSTWRKKYATHVSEWLMVIGEFEKFGSYANFSYNNPEFTFPEINDEKQIHFKDLGHPLIRHENSVTNTIDFQPQSFFILTGSNMSGKSTFLRTLGINMVLAGIGAPVYAKHANVYPMPVLVSMRLSDSLADSESYFYAEVKRLHYIMTRLNQEACFVLLDEILRGTNSDDKRSGTVEVIKKMANSHVYGGIATHDLEVCNVTEEFPKVLTNKRFEVEIIDDELVFDYKLRDGVCQNKSASFIMKKMGVI